MRKVGLVSRKGGVGKSTLAIHLAELAASAGDSVALLDLDLQESCTRWRKSREDDSVVVVRSSHQQLKSHLSMCERAGADWVFIDTRPDIDAATQDVCLCADFVVVPTRPSVMDLQSILGTLRLTSKLGVPSGVVFNLVPARGREARDARRLLAEMGYEAAPNNIVDRVAYRRAVGLGRVAGELDSKARREVINLWRYVTERMGAEA